MLASLPAAKMTMDQRRRKLREAEEEVGHLERVIRRIEERRAPSRRDDAIGEGPTCRSGTL